MHEWMDGVTHIEMHCVLKRHASQSLPVELQSSLSLTGMLTISTMSSLALSDSRQLRQSVSMPACTYLSRSSPVSSVTGRHEQLVDGARGQPQGLWAGRLLVNMGSFRFAVGSVLPHASVQSN